MSLALLVTGGRGQLAGELLAMARRRADIPFARGLSSKELDVTDPFDVRDVLAQWARVVRSDDKRHRLVVVNAAAYTAVDEAEADEQGAYAVNAAGPALLSVSCAAVGARLVHLSTDYVFSGESDRPYEVDDPTGPASAYGRTKLAGELAVRELLPNSSWVVRTAWLHAAVGHNFVTTMVRLEREREIIEVVDDQLGSPTWARDLAAGLLALTASDAAPGTYHATAGGQTSWWGLARAVFEELGADPDRVLATTTGRLGRAAPRPAYSVLSNARWLGAGLSELQPWRPALAQALQDARRPG